MSEKIKILNRTSLCYQCGTCAASCRKSNSIEMKYDLKKGMILPFVDDATCTNCGICEKVCPILTIEGPKDQFDALATEILSATDTDIFNLSSSGGSTGGILKFLFDTKQIDCAVVAGIEGIYAKSRIISSANEIGSIQGSKYQPVALNEILKELGPQDRFALVGLPCHIDGVKKLERFNKQLRQNLVVTIGIYCTIGRGLFATKAALSNQKNTGSLQYRFGSYPGDFGFLVEGEFEKISTYVEHLNQFDYFSYPKGCHYCDNLYNVNADISIGDTWGLECGKTGIVMSRSTVGSEIVQAAIQSNYLAKLRDATMEENLSTQEHSYHYKISNYFTRMKTISFLTHPIIRKQFDFKNKGVSGSFWYLLLYVFTQMTNNEFGYAMIKKHTIRKYLLKIRNQLLKRVG